MSDLAGHRVYRFSDNHSGSWAYYDGTTNTAYEDADSLLEDLELDHDDLAEDVDETLSALPVAKSDCYEVTPKHHNSMNNAGLVVQVVYDPVARHGLYHIVAIAVSDLTAEDSLAHVSWEELAQAAQKQAHEIQSISDENSPGDEDEDDDQ